MSSHPADLQPDRFLPEALEDRLLRFFARVSGVALFLALAAAWLSLVSWSSTDPSLTHATSEPVRNLIGYPGAVVSDLLLQTFGVAAVIVLTAPTFWALEMIVSGRVEAARTKAIYFPFAVLVLAGAASALPMASSWPLHHGFGGILGDGIYRLMSNIVALAVPGKAGSIAGVLLFAAGFAALTTSIGLALRDLAAGFGNGVRRGARDIRAAAGRIEPVLGAVRDTAAPKIATRMTAWGRGLRPRAECAAEHAAPDLFDDAGRHHEGLAPMSAERAFEAQPSPPPLPPASYAQRGRANTAGAHPFAHPFAPPGPTAHDPRTGRPHVGHPHVGHPHPGSDQPHGPAAHRADPFARDPGQASAARAPFPPADGPNASGAGPQGWSAFVPPPHADTGPAGPVPPSPPGFVGRTGALPRILRRPGSPEAPEPGDQDIERGDFFDTHTDAMSRAMARRFAPRAAGEDLRAAVSGPHRAMQPGASGSSGSSGPSPTAAPPPAPTAVVPSEPASSGRADQRTTRATRDIHDQPPVGARADDAKLPTLLKGMKFGGSGGYQRPSLNLLKQGAARGTAGQLGESALKANARLLEEVLKDFGVKGEIKGIEPGPVVTLYAFEPARGVKTSRVIGLADDIARSMSALSARVGVIPGRNLIGIELPNQHRQTVLLRELLESDSFRSAEGALPIVLGKGISGEPVVADLARMPHLLVAGTTGSGKSVGVNAMILSLLYRLGPDQCRLLMIDPKMLELSVYNDIPHLLAPVVTDPAQAVGALNWVVGEMEERYKRMAQLSVRNIDVFNNRVRNAKKRGEILSRSVQTGYDNRTGEAIIEREPLDMQTMPYIVVVIDEFADLMMVAGKDVEAAVQRLAQMARAAGIHLIMATQRPSVDVITGTIKANFPTRVSFKVTSRIDSRTILNEQGAEQLLGRGDMLYAAGGGSARRLHGPFVADEEVEAIADALRANGSPEYVDIRFTAPEEEEAARSSRSAGSGKSMAELYDEAVELVLRERRASTSYIQRRLGIGYNRAAELIDRMEDEGLVSPQDRRGKRKVLDGRAEPDPLTGELPQAGPFPEAANDDEAAA